MRDTATLDGTGGVGGTGGIGGIGGMNGMNGRTYLQRGSDILLPIIEAEIRGQRRWCAGCMQLTLLTDLDICSGCHEVGYVSHCLSVLSSIIDLILLKLNIQISVYYYHSSAKTRNTAVGN